MENRSYPEPSFVEYIETKEYYEKLDRAYLRYLVINTFL